MPFGLTVAGNAFQYKLDVVFSNLDYSTGTDDDMIIWVEQSDGSDHENILQNLCRS